jgi:hypothetical protein
MKHTIVDLLCPGCEQRIKSVVPIPTGMVTCDHCETIFPTPRDFFDDTLSYEQIVELKMAQWALLRERRSMR